jgi:hypothetical protein
LEDSLSVASFETLAQKSDKVGEFQGLGHFFSKIQNLGGDGEK